MNYPYQWNFLPLYDDESEGAGEGSEGADEGSEGAGEGSGEGSSSAPKLLTQAQFDEVLKERLKQERSKLQDQNKKHVSRIESEYTQLMERHGTTEEEKESLANAVEDLRKQYRTAEEQAKIDKKRSEGEFQTQLKAANEKSEFWETKYTDSTIEVAISSASSKAEVWDVAQVIKLLRDQTKLVEEVDDDGNKTGKTVAMIELEDVDSESGKPFVALRSPDEAMERLRTLQPNLFKGNLIPGVGGTASDYSNTGANGKAIVKDMSPEDYRKLRKENPEALGL